MSGANNQVWNVLFDDGLVEGDVPENGELESPWYIKVLLAISGWLASLFLLGFIGVGRTSIIESSFASFVVGALMIGSAYGFLRIPKNKFYEHMALAISLAGQALIIWAIYDPSKSNSSLNWGLITLFQISLSLFMPNFVHRVMSSLFAVFTFLLMLMSMGIPYLFSSVIMLLIAMIWLNEFRYPQYMSSMRAIGYGLVLALIPIKGTILFGQGRQTLRYLHGQTDFLIQPWIGELLTSVVVLYIVINLLKRNNQPLFGRLGYAVIISALIICAASFEVPGITVGVVILLLGFAGSNRVLMGIGIVSLLFFVSSYYYLLEMTLLNKAQILLYVGLILLAVRWLALHYFPIEKEVRNA